MGGVLARRRHHPPRNLGLGPRPDRARRLVGLPFGRRAPARSASSSPPSASRSRRQASAPTLSSSGKAQRRRSGPTAAISSFRRRRPQTTVSIIGCSRTAMTATRPPPHPATPPSAAITFKGKTVALIRHEGAVEEDCRIADIVIAPFTIGQRCRAARVIVDRRVLKAEGAQRSILRACRSGPRRSRPGAGIGLGFPIGPA